MQKEIFTKSKQLTVEIDVTKNQIHVVKDGRVISIDPPASGYGEQVAVWLNGKVDRVDTKFTEKIK
ncbi:DUF3954 domain-containing protein [Bacillus cereus]|nr:DUF3954 domain-containing protein [Bacillus cereus]